jgi:hypothetical protein
MFALRNSPVRYSLYISRYFIFDNQRPSYQSEWSAIMTDEKPEMLQLPQNLISFHKGRCASARTIIIIMSLSVNGCGWFMQCRIFAPRSARWKHENITKLPFCRTAGDRRKPKNKTELPHLRFFFVFSHGTPKSENTTNGHIMQT